MNRDGNDWMAPLEQHDLMMLQPDLQSSGFPIHPAKKQTLFQRRRRVRFATQLTVEAHIPANYWERMERAKPPKLTFQELRERVETLTREVCEERRAVVKEQEILYHYKQEHEAMKHSREHISRLKRVAIQELQQECDKLEQNILEMKCNMEQMKHQSMVGQQRKRRLSQRSLSQRELYSNACTKARVPTIWGRPRLQRMNSLEIMSCA